jgi:hypothetical protein
MNRCLLLLLLVGLFKTVSAQLPVITQNLSNANACIFGKTTAYIPIVASNVSTYVWQLSTDSGNTWSTISGSDPSYAGSSTSVLSVDYTSTSMNGYEFRCILSNASGSDTSNVSVLYGSTTAPSSIPAFVNPTTAVCEGSTQAYQCTDVDQSDTVWWTLPSVFPYPISPNNVLDDSIVLVNFSNLTGSRSLYLSYVSNACGSFYPGPPVFTTVTVDALQSTPAGTAGGGPVCATFSVYPNASTTYSDGTCSPIAAVTPSGSSPVSGTINSCVTVDASVPTYNGVPYVPRYYNLEPATNPSTSTATVTLYFTQADFDGYNAVRGSNPALPTGPTDSADMVNLTISQFHGSGTTPGTYVGTTGTIVPGIGNVVWNSTDSRWEVTFSVTGFSGFFASGGSIIPLPLTLTDFSGQATPMGNLLSWTTTMEQNTAYFEVQRSAAGGSGFEDLARVAAPGNSQQTIQYQYTDTLSGPSHPAYAYRLKMVDADGSFTYSRIVTLQAVVGSLTIRVQPNPFVQPSALIVSAPAAGDALVTITDMSGRKLVEKDVLLQQGDNTLDPSMVSMLSRGVYLMSVTMQTQQQTVKFVKE